MPSSVIKAYHYDAVKQVLKIVYVSGVVYNYIGVPTQVFEEFRYAFSKGRYLNQYIKPNFQYQKDEDLDGC